MCGGNRRKPPTQKNFITMLYRVHLAIRTFITMLYGVHLAIRTFITMLYRVHLAIRTYLSQSATYWKTNTAKTLKLLGFSFVLEKNHVGNGRCLPEMHGLSFVVTKGLSIPHYREEYELILFSTYIDNLIVMKKLTYKPFPN